MLNGASAALAEVPADGRHAFGTRFEHLQQTGALAIDFGIDTFARERERYEDVPAFNVCDAVALRPEPIDDKFPRVTHRGALRAEIPRCPSRREWATAFRR
jgi:hypothetical protein